jgi:hypothetical protein
LVADGYVPHFKTVKSVKIIYPLFGDRGGLVFISEIVASSSFFEKISSNAFELFQFADYPLRVIEDKTLYDGRVYAVGRDCHKIAVAVDNQPHPPGPAAEFEIIFDVLP